MELPTFLSLSSDNELLITDHRNQRLSCPSPGAALSSLNSRSILERRMATPKVAEIKYFPPKVIGSWEPANLIYRNKSSFLYLWVCGENSCPLSLIVFLKSAESRVPALWPGVWRERAEGPGGAGELSENWSGLKWRRRTFLQPFVRAILPNVASPHTYPPNQSFIRLKPITTCVLDLGNL